ncbi:hemolysin activation/secretion protein [Rivularia sp. PCC 7116]|uniref:ShlB/FhaC/HecB family hemolysin secretion/activation protein n=1 Tax=Rivularia sp. PCC 7116 TaxID=373994 RepID=UPI00029F3106|nr:ShlB/FhaC/HecB family hemolysin secretion/activation protein [Rivularia sp. PCC 7116]AFY57566.1 hemolysin activation/secretion protein [Rivularia sp. PCC 7116]
MPNAQCPISNAQSNIMVAKSSRNLTIWCCYLSSFVLPNLLILPLCKAQTVNPDLPSPQDVQPPTPQTAPTPRLPVPLPPPSELLEPSTPNIAPPQTLPDIPDTVIIQKFEVVGSTVFSEEKLAAILKPFTNKPITFEQLSQAKSAIIQLYIDNEYITSGAYLPVGQDIEDGVVQIVVVEGKLEEIRIAGNQRLKSSYIRSRIARGTKAPLNKEKLLESLRLLQINPLIDSLSAELSAGTRPGLNVLSVEVKEAPSFGITTGVDNNRSPSVGSFRRRLQLNQANLFGWGDGLNLAYSNTDGSNTFNSGYTLPVNSRNGTLSFNYSQTSSDIIERPFNRLDIESGSSNYDLTFRQPLVQTPTEELALGFTASRRNSEVSSEVLSQQGISLNELSPGADEDGDTRISVLRFFQEWVSRNQRQIVTARSEFSLGIDALNATVNSDAPDSRFFAWRGEAQWTRLLAPDTLLLIKGNVQLASERLVASEQFSLGGLENVRGYRQNFLLRDNGVFASAEVLLPIIKASQIDGLLQIAPFIDIGTTWNNSGAENINDTNTLASVGLGLRWRQGDNLSARFDWGIPLISVDKQGDSLQENGFYFSVQYSPF